MPLYLTQCLNRAVQAHPELAATVFGGRQHTYRQYAERCSRLAGALHRLGMQRGDRIGMLAFNSDRYLEFYYGTWWGGGAVNPVNFRWSAAEIAYSLDDCDTRILLVDEQFKSVAAELRGQSKALRTLVYTGDGDTPEGMLNYEQLLSDTTPAVDAAAGGNDLAAVMYTGGTTGFPKGVMLSHENFASNALALVGHGAAASGGRSLLIAPMFHVAAGCVMNATAAAGGTFIIAPAFNPIATLGAVQQHKVTHMVLVPTMVQLAVDHPDAGNYDLGSLRTLAYGGSVISAAVLQRAMARFPNAGFLQVYGMTEMAPTMTVLTPQDHLQGANQPDLLRSAGRASLVTEMRVVDVHGNEVPRGTVGEVVARGPGVMLGYWNKPDLTAVTVKDGWMHTGDGGRMDENGYLYIVDRMKDMIVSGGENVYSAEVENAVARHPSVAACAVIGIPSEQWGEMVHAVVVLKSGMSGNREELIKHCHEIIAGYKCPRSVEFRESLPTSGAGKVLKTELRKPYWEGHTRNVN